MQELEAKMDTSSERLKGKIEACNTRLESKIKESNQRLEAMFRQLIAVKALHSETTPQQVMDPAVPATPVLLQVSPTPTAIMDMARPPSPNHAASSVSNHSAGQEPNVGAAKDKGGRTSMEEAEGGGSEEGHRVVGTTTVAEVVENVDDVNTTAAAIGTPEPLRSEQNQEVVETPIASTGYVRRNVKPANVTKATLKTPKTAGLSKPAKNDTPNIPAPSQPKQQRCAVAHASTHLSKNSKQ